MNLTTALHPFIGARLNPARDDNGYVVPRTHAVDVHEARIAHVDADVRAVTDEGVRIFFDSGSQVIAWEAITAVQIVRRGDVRAVEQSFGRGDVVRRVAA